MDETNSRLKDKLEAHGVFLDAIDICPHTPDERCHSRKPKPGFALQAAKDLGFGRTKQWSLETGRVTSC